MFRKQVEQRRRMRRMRAIIEGQIQGARALARIRENPAPRQHGEQLHFPGSGIHGRVLPMHRMSAKSLDGNDGTAWLFPAPLAHLNINPFLAHLS
jgi:hypothetical protein